MVFLWHLDPYSKVVFVALSLHSWALKVSLPLAQNHLEHN